MMLRLRKAEGSAGLIAFVVRVRWGRADLSPADGLRFTVSDCNSVGRRAEQESRPPALCRLPR